MRPLGTLFFASMPIKKEGQRGAGQSVACDSRERRQNHSSIPQTPQKIDPGNIKATTPTTFRNCCSQDGVFDGQAFPL
jgi:hypothetical protein